MEVKQKPHLHHDWIDPLAREIVETLQRHGATTYLVGGCVRDLLVNIHPKDFDIATMADPETVRRLIRKAYIIGRRFRLVLVRRGDQQFEVSTFRRESRPEDFPDGIPHGDNVFGSPEEDALRRDFTINGLFYDPIGDKLIDYTGGVRDIDLRLLRMIGEPGARLSEDPIRILRAIRLAHKLQFSLEPELRRAISVHAHELAKSVLPRKREEYLKILRLSDCALTFYELFDLGVLVHSLPSLNSVYENPEQAEHFSSYLHRLEELPHLNFKDPIDLFGMLVLAFVRTTVCSDPLAPVNAAELMENPKLDIFMREELGMFKLESQLALRALQLQPMISSTDDFIRKGPRRQAAVLRNDALPLALTMAELDVTADAAKIQFWRKKLAGEAHAESTSAFGESQAPVKRRRRRRSQRRRRASKAAEPDANSDATAAVSITSQA